MAARAKFDVKQFLLQRGEFVGLGVVGSIVTLLLVLAAVKGFSSPSPGANVNELDKSSKQIAQKLRSDGPADPTVYTVLAPGLANADKGIQLADSGEYRLGQPFFFPKGLNDSKRRGVNVMVPSEFRFQTTTAQLRSYQLRGDTGKPPHKVVLLKGAQAAAGAGGMGPMGGGPSPGGYGPGGLLGGGGGAGLFGGGGTGSGEGGEGAGYLGGMAGGRPQQEAQESNVTTVEALIADLHKPMYSSMRFAEDVLPVRMAIVAASFPYKKQLEEYQNKLQFRTLSELFADPTSAPTFLGVDVQRREVGRDGRPPVGPDGKIIPWQTVDLAKALKRLVVLTGRRFEAEDPTYFPMDFPGLVWRKPIQFQEGKYPQPEKDLPGLAKVLTAIKDANPKFKPKNPFDDKEVDIYNPAGTTNQGFGGSGAAPGTGSPEGGVGGSGIGPLAPGSTGTPEGGFGALNQQQLLQIPEFCMVRFIDVTVEPGKSYNYQMRIRMRNPNYGREKDVAWKSLAEDKEIRSDWVLVKDDSDPARPIEEQAKVSIAPEAHIYAVDQAVIDAKGFSGSRTRPREDQTVVQVHRWVDYVRPNPADTRVGFPVGDWLIGERLMATRGEYLSRTEKVEVPVWLMKDEKFSIMQYQKDKKVPVAFNMDSGQGDLLLVDFQGGELTYRKLRGTVANKEGALEPVFDTVTDKAPTELMFLSPSGKLLVHSSEKDKDDEARIKRYEAVKARAKQIKETGGTGKPGETNPFGPPGGGGKP